MDKQDENTKNYKDTPLSSSVTQGFRANSALNSERFFRSVYENASDAIFLMDGDTFIDCNRKTEEIFGCNCENILQRKPRDFSPPKQPDGTDSGEKSQKYIDAALSGTPQFFEWKHRRPDGSLFDAEVSLNRVDIESKMVIMAVVRDITRRRNAEEELKKAYDELELRVEKRTSELKKANELLKNEITRREKTQDALGKSEARYRDFLEQVNSIVLEMDTRGIITFINRFGRSFFGYKKSEILGKSVMGTIVPEKDYSGGDLRELIQNILQSPEVYFSSENENIKKNGERVWIAWTNRVIFNPDKDRTEILSIGIDRTAQKNAQESMAEDIKERAATEERNRLARELHDAVSQTLFSASLIAEVIPRLWEKNRKEGEKRLEEVRQLSRGALAEMRTLLFELRPAALAEAELSDLVRQLADTISGRWRLPVHVDISGTINLPPDVKISFYRIAQEALNNIAKHSGASEATVILRCEEDTCILMVKDNGRGFDQSVLPPDSLGIGIMKERAANIGADLIINSTKNQGTEVSVVWMDPGKEVG